MHFPLSVVLSTLVLVAPAVQADRLNKRMCSRRPTATPSITASTAPVTGTATATATAKHTDVASASTSTSSSAAATSTAGSSTDPKGPFSLATAPKSLANAVTSLKYTSVGGDGFYNMITSMAPGAYPSCTVNPSYTTTKRTVSGALAPFNEPLTLAFRGPMNIHHISVFQPNSDGSSWGLTSSFAAGQTPKNLVFMNNMGSAETSGEWSYCQGSSQSYASGDFTKSVKTPNAEIFPGNVPDGKYMNIMTATECNGSNCLGFSRGTANAGWGGSKLFVVEVDMPTDSGDNLPAMWMLNDQIVRSAQFGANCRGMGLNTKDGSLGGCGELDLLEALPEKDSNQVYSEMYSPKGATGSGERFFQRPTNKSAFYQFIFDEKTDAIAIQQLTTFDFTSSSVSRDSIDDYLNADAHVVNFSQGKKRREHRRGLHHGLAHEGSF